MNDYKKIEENDYDFCLSSKEGKYKVIRYYTNGKIWYEGYKINSIFHREDGPAYVSYYEDGNIYHEGYYINDKIHREDGPAKIWYHENKNVVSEEYRLGDIKFTKEKYYSPKIQAILDIAKMIDIWESKLNFINLSL